jgi:hypothetical protein
MGVGGCNVDENSLLRITDMTRDKCRTSLWQRPFVTVPYLGRGRTDTLVETNLRKGELEQTSASSKSEHPLSENSFQRYTTLPLLPQLRQDVGNSARKIEEDAANGWIRGGLPSREYDRRAAYSALGKPGGRATGASRDGPWCGDSQEEYSRIPRKAAAKKYAQQYKRATYRHIV